MGLMPRPFEIFFGTGGVGKTTLATARAVQLAAEGRRVLLMTIDPAKRLKDLLGLTDAQAGLVVPIPRFGDLPPFAQPLDVLLMSAPHTIQRMAESAGVPELSQNRIVGVLARPNGGMNEILALIELDMRFQAGGYDCVVLDTPPGPHFLDFLEGLDKIRAFFDARFVEIFASLGRKVVDAAPTRGLAGRLVGKFVGAGVQKLLSYLEKVTGAAFVEDFLQALQVIYRARGAFVRGLEMERRLTAKDASHWFLVTSVEQGKVDEALAIRRDAAAIAPQGVFLAVNKCLGPVLNEWSPEGDGAKLKASWLSKEQALLEGARTGFAGVLAFPEIFTASPLDHVRALAEGWKQHAHD
jgi:anion-transporting  ArsA/GET3 family ATPase